jgi:uncharacterized protein (TIGR00106 family)
MLVEFSIVPVGANHMSEELARVAEVLARDGIRHQLGPMSTCVQGDWDHVMAVIRRCHDLVATRHERVITIITLDDRQTDSHPLAEMVRRVEAERQRLTALAVPNGPPA